MVYTIPPRNAPNASFGNQMGGAISEGFLSAAKPAIQQQYQRGQLQKGLDQLRQKSMDPNATPQDLLYNLIEASGYSPEIGRNLPQLYAELNKAREAQRMGNVDFGGQGQIAPQQQSQQPFKPGGISAPSYQNNANVNQSIQQSRNFPNNIKGNQAPGNLPQEATSGNVRPVLSGDQILQKAQQRHQDLSRNGIVKPFEYAYEQVVNENEQNRLFNQNVENERIKRIQSQEKYGSIAEERLKKLVVGASDEESAIFKKIGEEAAGADRSEADIDRYITKEVNKYKNNLSNIRENLNAPRIQNQLKRSFLGENTDIKKAESDAKQAIKPLLDLELYDKSREELSTAGFYPEERERIIFGEMPSDIRKSINSIPKAISKYSPKEHPLATVRGLSPGQKEYDLKSRLNLFENISKTWGEGENDKINLLQMRKEYEDKGYDWRLFKDSMNELIESGHIQLNPDQNNQLNSYLNQPPLNLLEKIFHGLGLRGR